MTAARYIDGSEVLADEPARSPLTDKAGQPVYFKQIRELLLANGATVYGCAHCDYTADTAVSVRPHLNAHRDGARTRGAPNAAGGSAVTVLARENDKLTTDRNQWKRRALSAERKLSTLRRTLTDAN